MREKMKSSTLNSKKVVIPVALSLVLVSAALAFAGEAPEEGPKMMDWVWRFFNFGLVAALLGWVYAKYIKGILKSRIETIESALASARSDREEALKKLSEVEARLKDKDTELANIIRVSKENGAKEKALIIKDSEKIAADILSSATDSIGAELMRAKDAIRREAALMAVELAEKLVREEIKKEDHARIVEEYIAKVGG